MQRQSSNDHLSADYSPYLFDSSVSAAAAAAGEAAVAPELSISAGLSEASSKANSAANSASLTGEQKLFRAEMPQCENVVAPGVLLARTSAEPERILVRDDIASRIHEAEIDETMSETQKKIITQFNLIRSLAAEGREQQLAELLKDNICVDMRYGDASPVNILAREGQHAAVDLLMNQFGASMHEVVSGYAQGGYVDKVNKLLKMGALPLEAIRGYAKAGNFKACNALCDETLKTSRILHPIDCHVAAVSGFAYFNSIDLVSERLEMIKNLCQNESPIFSKFNILGHCIDNCTDDMSNFIVSKQDQATLHFAKVLIAIYGAIGSDSDDYEPMHPEHRIFAGYGLAVRGEFNKIKDWATAGMSSSRNYLEGVAQGLAFSGRYDKVVLTLPHANREQVLFAYACGGHVEQVNELIASGCRPEKALLGYARFGHIKACENLFEKYGAQYSISIGEVGRLLYLAGYLCETPLIHRTITQFKKEEHIAGMMMLFSLPVISKLMKMTSTPTSLNIFKFRSNLRKSNQLFCKMSDLYNIQSVGLNQIQQWKNPEVRNWIINYYQPSRRRGDGNIFSHLPKEVFHIITSILFDLSEKDSASIHIKICVPMFRNIFAHNLKKYISDLKSEQLLRKGKSLLGSKSAKLEINDRLTCLTLATSLFNKINPASDRGNQHLDEYALELLNEQNRLHSSAELSESLVTESGQRSLEKYKSIVNRACLRI